MRKTELKELYKMMFPDYPDIVTVSFRLSENKACHYRHLSKGARF